ncbi:hypothetical protein OU415_02440 [Saccharopolyspora sp. WRP15-2]|uniref:Uncharacterized protein n=1 Tax=Saccharopolyspora oryzae TaxID=2997343 RepID=A0ABT4URC6_9PSEU|nr:hypothetical protein [Saccharopolyspora oryzae]MDA3624276.1 hypothetical protein [Saccharopolyspora oryzae]
MGERSVGEIVDQLGVKTRLTKQDHVTDVLVVLRIQNAEDGMTRVGVSYSPGTDSVVRRGLVELAKDFEEVTAMHMIDLEDEEDGA